MMGWDMWKKGFDVWESATAAMLEQVLKNPLVLGPTGALLSAAMKAKAGRDKASAPVLGRARPAHQARSGADPARAEPAPEPPDGSRRAARGAKK